MKILEGLNPAQVEAVKHGEGPLLILAGAGSGKTRVLAHRIAYLIAERGVRAERILAVTFTNKAAAEMAERVRKLLAHRGELPTMGTFHSIAARILRRELARLGLPWTPGFVIFDEDDSRALVKKSLEALELDPKQWKPGAVLATISGAKSELIPAKIYAERYGGLGFERVVAAVYPRYQAALQQQNAMDFDDLLMVLCERLRSDERFLERYQRQFQYLLIDEYQDTNTAQYEMARLFGAKHRNVCVVGDDWQAIYTWRGADFRNILSFKQDYPEAKVVKLEANYRSTREILEAAARVIAHNVERTEKTLHAVRGAGRRVSVIECSDGEDEAEFVATEIGSLRSLAKLSDIAILYRTHAQSRLLEERLLDHELAYRIFGGVRFYERREIKDLIAYLRLIHNPNDLVAFERIVNVPARGIGKGSLRKHERGETIPAVQGFLELLDELRAGATKLTPGALLRLVMKRIEYRAYLDDGTPEVESRLENVEELLTRAEEAKDLVEFLEGVALIQAVDNYDRSADAVTLMTLHNAKGLEFEAVFIVGCEEGLLPHSRSLLTSTELEEERRLMYVGMTRAKSRLYLSHAEERGGFGRLQVSIPSRFLAELPEAAVEFV